MRPTCAAFTRLNIPCKNHVASPSEVCATHENFYNPDNWFKQYPLSNNSSRHYSSECHSDLKEIYRIAILDGRVCVTQDHLKDLEASARDLSLIDYYMLCCQRSDVDPLWSPKLFSRAITNVIHAHRPRVFDMTLANHRLLLRYLDPIFNGTTRSFSYMVYSVLYYVIMLEIKHFLGQSTSARNLDNEQISLLHYIESHSKFSDLLWEHSDREENLRALVNSREPIQGSCHEKIKAFVERLSVLRAKQRESQIVKISGIRNALRNCLFHPSMILDVQEYKGLQSRWPGMISV